jgi:hypothetical protein
MNDLLAEHSAIMDKYDTKKQLGLAIDEWGAWLKAKLVTVFRLLPWSERIRSRRWFGCATGSTIDRAAQPGDGRRPQPLCNA